MSRHDAQRLTDILPSADAITAHIRPGGLDDGLIYDAVRVRLIEIGEAVKSIDPALLAHEPDIPWIDIAGIRNHIAHRYFDTAHSIVAATITHDLQPLVAAVERLLARFDHHPETLTFTHPVLRVTTNHDRPARSRRPVLSGRSGVRPCTR